jgi:hypothetical protein
VPTTPKSVEPGQNTTASSAHSTVPVSATVQLPRRFTRSFVTLLDDDRAASTVIAVAMNDEGEPMLEEYRFRAPRGGLRARELRRPDLPGLVQWAYEQQVASELVHARLASEGGHLELDDEQGEAIYAEARTIARPRGAYKITDEFLTDVLEQERQGGVKLVMKENDTSERTARRWLREARVRGLA